MRKKEISPQTIYDFEVYLRNEERSDSTIEKYARDVRRFAEFAVWGKIDKQIVMAYKQMLGHSYAVASANSMIAAMNTFLRFCGRPELCVKQFRVQRQTYCPETKELTKAEYLRLLKTAEERKNERLSLILQSICGTGIRVSELSYITVEALRRGEAVVSAKGKCRRIFIVSELRKKLLRYAQKRGVLTGAVFVTKNGNPIGRSNIWKEMKALCEQADVLPSKVFPHNLRHLFARMFYRVEKDLAKLADILGHSSINTTRIYIVTTGEEHRQRMEQLHLIL